MRNLFLLLAAASVLSLGAAKEASAAGRVSRFAAMQRLGSPFDTLDFSSFSSSAFGLPVFDNGAPVTAASNYTPPASAELSPVVVSSPVRTPYRPRVRSPFRPPPRPSLP